MNQIALACLLVACLTTGALGQENEGSSSTNSRPSNGLMPNLNPNNLMSNLPFIGQNPGQNGQGMISSMFSSDYSMLPPILQPAMRIPGRAIQMAGDGISGFGSMVSNVGGRLSGNNGQRPPCPFGRNGNTGNNGLLGGLTNFPQNNPLQALPNQASQGINRAQGALSDMSNQARNGLNNAQESLSSMANEAQNTASQAARRGQEAISNMAGQAQDAASQVFGQGQEALSNMATGAQGVARRGSQAASSLGSSAGLNGSNRS